MAGQDGAYAVRYVSIWTVSFDAVFSQRLHSQMNGGCVLDNFFKPKSVAVIGASREEGKTGHSILSNLINYKFPGQIFPVNPKASEILGLKTFPSLEKIDDAIDLAVIVIPPKFMSAALDDCAKKGIKAQSSCSRIQRNRCGRRKAYELKSKASAYIRLAKLFGLIDTN